jgi:hypothetical protein
VPNGGVDAAARIKAPSAAPSKLRNTLPPLASNDLLSGVAIIDAVRTHRSRGKVKHDCIKEDAQQYYRRRNLNIKKNKATPR